VCFSTTPRLSLQCFSVYKIHSSVFLNDTEAFIAMLQRVQDTNNIVNAPMHILIYHMHAYNKFLQKYSRIYATQLAISQILTHKVSSGMLSVHSPTRLSISAVNHLSAVNCCQSVSDVQSCV